MKKSFKFYLAIIIAKIMHSLLKIFRKNGGTHIPGKIAIKICPDFLGQIAKPNRIIGVTGTNGKTTVSNLIIDSLEKMGYRVLNNRTGGNINTGIASALLSGTSISNKSKYDVAVFEIDERSAIKVYPYIKPDFIVCTNLFRDSLRRNAHPEYISGIINSALPKESTLILNADDLISGSLGKDNKRVYFGIDKLDTDLTESINIINDMQICPKCHTKLKYNYVRYHHIGNAYCPNCDFKSPEADYKVKSIDYEKNSMIVGYKNNEQEYSLISNSLFNIYNEIAVITLLHEFGISSYKIQEIINNVKIVESRYNNENVNGINVVSNLAKGQNAVACSCVFDYVKKSAGKKEVVLILDDFFDAKSTSESLAWIYDCDFEFLNSDDIEKIVITGKRSQDYYLRLLIAGVPKEKISCVRNEPDAFNYLSLTKGETVYILYDVYNGGIANKVKENIVNKITGGDK